MGTRLVKDAGNIGTTFYQFGIAPHKAVAVVALVGVFVGQEDLGRCLFQQG